MREGPSESLDTLRVGVSPSERQDPAFSVAASRRGAVWVRLLARKCRPREKKSSLCMALSLRIPAAPLTCSFGPLPTAPVRGGAPYC